MCPTASACPEHGVSLCSATAHPGGRKGKGFAGVNLASLPSVGKAQGKSTHGGHFPYVSYLKVINQANKPLSEICSVLLPC